MIHFEIKLQLNIIKLKFSVKSQKMTFYNNNYNKLIRCIFYVFLIFILNSSLLDLKSLKPRKVTTDAIVNKNLNHFEDNFNYTSDENTFWNFENFDSLNGLNNTYLVPNLIHYINLNQKEISFAQFLSIISSWKVQKPNRIYLHCDLCEYEGKYWNKLNEISEIKSILKVEKIFNFDSSIFRKKPGWIHHKSDVLRIIVLMNYGGIYLDNDMILIQSLDKYRHYEMCVSWDSDNDGIGNQVLIANKNARLLRAMFDGYRF
jgi:mannosyltransferase OCH1-like enzyme